MRRRCITLPAPPIELSGPGVMRSLEARLDFELSKAINVGVVEVVGVLLAVIDSFVGEQHVVILG